MRPILALLLPPLMLAQTTTPPAPANTATPIRHLVVIFQENISFDHYFGTYPNALNPPGQPEFHAHPNTPSVNGLSGGLMVSNPNLNQANGASATNPFRLDRSQAATADQNHAYGPEQAASHGGLMDLFPKMVGTAGSIAGSLPSGVGGQGVVMGYYDGNTVTALWNYAQRYAMSDNSYSTVFGPSTPGAINLISGQTNGVINNMNGTSLVTDGGNGSLSVINDPDPVGDVCSASTREQIQMSGKNIGDMLNAAGVTWGFFTDGFDLTRTNPDGSTGCSRSSTSSVVNSKSADYIPHHQPFQYYKSTANPTHARPTSVAKIGFTDQANHQYDIQDFYAAVGAGNMPAVSYLKAPAIQDGHAGYSDPLDEQQFIVHVINYLQTRPEWPNTAVVIAYDDSDGWYDHQMPPLVNQSTSPADALLGTGSCGDGTTALAGVDAGNAHAQGRCGYGPRQPLLVISPWSKRNFVDHSVTDQTSILRFVEDNWLGGQRVGQGSFDALAGTIENMFDFTRPRNNGQFLLDELSGVVITNTNR